MRNHIVVARETQLPLIVHTRNADAKMATILKEEMLLGNFSGVLHCFTSGQSLANTALELGFYLSLSGIVTFKNAENLRKIIKDVPLERLLVETDSPYLTPVPYRGRRNEPAFIINTATKGAEIKGVSLKEFSFATTENFFRLFSKANKKNFMGFMRVTILGCGSSNGVPTITGNWGVCDPKNPKNRRRRPSILLEKSGFNLLIDTSTDLREQLLDAKCKQIDAVLYTHEHADHVMGIDDLRAIRRQMKRNIEVFAASEVIESLKTRFGYLFSGIQNPKNLYRPIFNPNEIVNPKFPSRTIFC